MKFIDEKGRLFGIINVFDLLVLCIIVSFAFFAIKWLQMAEEDPFWTRVKILHTRCIASVSGKDYVIELVKEGDETLNEDGLVVARIEKIINKKPANVIVYSSKDGEKLFFPSEKTIKLTLILDILTYERQNEIFSCAADKPLKVGHNFLMGTKNYIVNLSIHKILQKGEIVDVAR